jgi:hypothetical protein
MAQTRPLVAQSEVLQRPYTNVNAFAGAVGSGAKDRVTQARSLAALALRDEGVLKYLCH